MARKGRVVVEEQEDVEFVGFDCSEYIERFNSTPGGLDRDRRRAASAFLKFLSHQALHCFKQIDWLCEQIQSDLENKAPFICRRANFLKAADKALKTIGETEEWIHKAWAGSVQMSLPEVNKAETDETGNVSLPCDVDEEDDF